LTATNPGIGRIFPVGKITGIILGPLKRRLRRKLCGFAAISADLRVAVKFKGIILGTSKRRLRPKFRQLGAEREFLRISKNENATRAQAPQRAFTRFQLAIRGKRVGHD
jgi:hypothetical protein